MVLHHNIRRNDGGGGSGGGDPVETGIPNVLRRPRGDSERPFGDHLFTRRGDALRPWDPRRSKLAAYILKGVEGLPLREDTHVLYLGAANGTTASHVADICASGMVHCVEFSKRSFRDLIRTCEAVRNMVPILGDARMPRSYTSLVGKVDLVYQDIAQRDQTAIFMKNLRAFVAPARGDTANGILMVKARSIDVKERPKRIFDTVLDELGRETKVLDHRTLEPFEKDHMAVMARF